MHGIHYIIIMGTTGHYTLSLHPCMYFNLKTNIIKNERSNSPVKLCATGCYPLQKSWLASVASLLQLQPKAHLENGRQNNALCHRVGEYPAFRRYAQAELGIETPTHWQRCFHPKWINTCICPVYIHKILIIHIHTYKWKLQLL